MHCTGLPVLGVVGKALYETFCEALSAGRPVAPGVSRALWLVFVSFQSLLRARVLCISVTACVAGRRAGGRYCIVRTAAGF